MAYTMLPNILIGKCTKTHERDEENMKIMTVCYDIFMHCQRRSVLKCCVITKLAGFVSFFLNSIKRMLCVMLDGILNLMKYGREDGFMVNAKF